LFKLIKNTLNHKGDKIIKHLSFCKVNIMQLRRALKVLKIFDFCPVNVLYRFIITQSLQSFLMRNFTLAEAWYLAVALQLEDMAE